MHTPSPKLVFFILFSSALTLFGQSNGEIWSDWQQQILERVDPEDLTEASYEAFLATLADLDLERYYQRLDSIYGDSLRVHRPYTHQQLFLRTDRTLERRAGYREGMYAGDPWHHSLRYSLKAGKSWTAGCALDQDAGESWRTRVPWFDSYSFYLQYRPHRRLRAIVGNYRLRLGQGLLLNQQFALGKTFWADYSRHPLLSPQGSPSEGDGMQGAVMEYRLGAHLSFLPFVSARQIDGTLHSDTLTTWSQGGLHRTALERAQRHTAWLTEMGIHAAYRNEWMEVGANLLYSQFQHDYVRPERVYNRQVFRGHQLMSVSIDYLFHWYRFWLTGELAMDEGGHLATVGSLRRSVGEEWNASVHWRFLSDRYQQLHGATLAESSQLQGERGMTLQLQGNLSRHLTLTSLLDYWHFTTPQYGIYAPSRGVEGQLRLRYQRQHLKIQGTYRLKWKARNDTQTTDDEEDLTHYLRHTIDGLLNWQVTPVVAIGTQVRSRIYSAANTGGYSKGVSGSQALVLSPVSFPSKIAFQATWFHTDDYDTRLYLSEPTLLYGFDLPMLYGRGQRYSVNAQYTIPGGEHLTYTLELKYALCHYTDHRETISSGAQEIRGNNQQNLWMQFRMKW